MAKKSNAQTKTIKRNAKTKNLRIQRKRMGKGEIKASSVEAYLKKKLCTFAISR